MATKFCPASSLPTARYTRHLKWASEVLGSLEKARQWLHRHNRALGGEPPISQLDTEIGERQVEEVLLRISYGIYS